MVVYHCIYRSVIDIDHFFNQLDVSNAPLRFQACHTHDFEDGFNAKHKLMPHREYARSWIHRKVTVLCAFGGNSLGLRPIGSI